MAEPGGAEPGGGEPGGGEPGGGEPSGGEPSGGESGGWFATTHKLRFNDCDPAGHVNNAVYAVMAEAGRTDLMIAAGLKVPNEAFAMVIVRLEIDFKHEMNWPGDVLIQTAVARIGGKSIHMRQTIASGGVETAQAVSILAAIDRHTRRAIALDRTWHERFAPWTLPG